MNAKRNVKSASRAIMHLNATAEMALRYRDMILTAARTVDQEVNAIEESQSWDTPKIHALPLV